MPRLVIRAPDGTTESVPLEPGRIVFGRAHDSRFCYPSDFSLSRRHLALDDDGDGWYVEDLRSKNGTWVNGERIAARQRLRHGDRIEAGHVHLTFEPPDVSSDSVMFYPEPEHPGPQRTIMARLEGVLSGVESLQDAPSTTGASPPASFALEGRAVRALIEAGRELSGRRPLSELFTLILNLSIDAVGAERGAVLIQEEGGLVPRAVRGDGLQISNSVRDTVLQTKTSVLVADLLESEAFKNQQSIAGQHIRSMMAVPLQAEDQVLGLVYVDSRRFLRPFNQQDLGLLTVLGNVAAIRIEHERLSQLELTRQLMARDLEQAAIIQRGLLPVAPPSLEGVDLAGHNASCRTVGGDYYDFLSYPDGRVALVLGDVAGKGMPAAILMAGLQARVHLLAEEPGDLTRMMGRLNRILAGNCPTNRFVSLFFCILDPATGELSYCNAGHNPPLLVRADGTVLRLQCSGPVLGILPDIGYGECRERLEREDLLVLFSDGVTEATDPEGEEFGEERLLDLLRRCHEESAAGVIESVLQALHDWLAGSPPADDVTLLAARRSA